MSWITGLIDNNKYITKKINDGVMSMKEGDKYVEDGIEYIVTQANPNWEDDCLVWNYVLKKDSD